MTITQRQNVINGFEEYKKKYPYYIASIPAYQTIFHICWLIYCEETERISFDVFFDKCTEEEKLMERVDSELWQQAIIIYRTGQ